MAKKRSKLLFVILITLELFAIAPAEPVRSDACCRVEVFGDVDDRGLDTRLSGLFTHLNYYPGATAYVIVYGGADAVPYDREHISLLERIRQLVAFRGYSTSRFVLLDGGFREFEGGEFYMVPPNGEVPVPTKTVARREITGSTFLWARKALVSESEAGVLEEFVNRAVLYRSELDEHFDDYPPPDNNDSGPEIPLAEPGDTPPELKTANKDDDLLGYMLPRRPDSSESEAPTTDVEPARRPWGWWLTNDELEDLRYGWADKDFGRAIARRDGSRGVMIFYGDDGYYDLARLHTFIEEGRDRIGSAADQDPATIEVVFGGYRHQVEVEYWIVPVGAAPPAARPGKRHDNNN